MGIYVPTVIGLILTPSSRCALTASSESLLCKTRFPHRVLTKVVRPRVFDKFCGLCMLRTVEHTSSRCSANHQTELYAFLDVLLSAHLDLKESQP